MDKKNAPPRESGKDTKSSGHLDARHAFFNETDEMHQKALEEINARGEDPQKILRDMDAMTAKLREQYLRPDQPTTKNGTAPEPYPEDPSEWAIGSAIYFEESVAAGYPTPGQPIDGRPADFADLMQGINPAGMLLVKVSGASMTGAAIEHGDTVLVDPKADIRDGDLVLANIAGHGQVVKRLRITETGEAILESENPDFKPIFVAVSADLRIHGKVVWRGGPLR